MIELRARTRISAHELESKKGKLVTEDDYNVLLTRAAKVTKPDGRLLCVYVPGALTVEMDEAWATLRKIKMKSDNRGLASGTKRVNAGGNRSRAMPVVSGILGAMDPTPNRTYCRLTNYSREHIERWHSLFPLLRAIGRNFKEHVPDRYELQQEIANRTNPDWIVPGTPFTTITVNNSYATGVHTDNGDLDEGFSCLAVGRTPNFKGGSLTFPEYRLAVNMQHGDLLLMDAHDWHGNTAIHCACGNRLNTGPCSTCGGERISVVCYYRTKMKVCDSMAEEDAKREQQTASRVATD